MLSTADLATDPPSSLGPLQSLVLPVFGQVNAAILVELCLYGIHLVLFIICVFILLRYKKSSQLVNLVAAIIMFCLSTADIALSIRLVVHDLPAWFSLDLKTLLLHLRPKGLLFVTNNLIADMLLLYRWYMIWGRNLYVLLISSIILLADTVWGWVRVGRTLASLDTSKLSIAYLWSVFAMNIIITAMTVSRIFWISRNSQPLEEQYTRRYNIIMAALVESGAIYSLCILLYLVVPNGQCKAILFLVVLRIVAIMPTLMIVQVALGQYMKVPYSSSRSTAIAIRRESIVLDTLDSLNARQESAQPYPSVLHSTQEQEIPMESERQGCN